ncbi:hypothetical protein [Pseudokineococcus sp. 1T1Z-3]|uniref:hypothetical protein n=1 Tax=Pseudokineococcus sp. 1T1Z-3 TaxID=3132745 RepID=UPI00309A214D
MGKTEKSVAAETEAAQSSPGQGGYCRAHLSDFRDFVDYMIPRCACHLLPGLAPRTTQRSAAITLEATAARRGAALQVREAVANHGPIRARATAGAARTADEWAERASDPLDDEMVPSPRCLHAAWHAANNAVDLAAPDEIPMVVHWDNPTFAAGWENDFDRRKDYSPNAPMQADDWDDW